MNACTHIHDNGEPCQAIPVRNTPYCYFHRKYYNPPALPGDPNYVAPLLESHESIQLAATHLYQSFLSRKMDSKQVALSLNLLKLAAKAISAIERKQREAAKEQGGKAAPPQAQPDAGKKEELKGKNVSEAATGLPNVGTGFQSRAAERSSAPTTAAAPPRRIYDPYGCMPKEAATK